MGVKMKLKVENTFVGSASPFMGIHLSKSQFWASTDNLHFWLHQVPSKKEEVQLKTFEDKKGVVK